MKKKNISETTKKHNEEIIERMKKVINIKNDVDLTINSDITKNDVANFKSQDTGTFYKKIIDFCIKHNVNIIWLIGGVGEMYIQTPQTMPGCPDELDLIRAHRTLSAPQKEAIKTILDSLKKGDEQPM